MTTSIVRDQARGEHARSRVAEVAAGKSPVLLIADLSVQADIRRSAKRPSQCGKRRPVLDRARWADEAGLPYGCC